MNNMPNKEIINDRIKACLTAGALGDALGYAVEFRRWEEIQGRYGKNGIREPSLTRGKAIVSDDTQMTLFTAEGLINRAEMLVISGGGTTADSLAEDTDEAIIGSIYRSYLWWLDTQNCADNMTLAGTSRLSKLPELRCERAPGNTCLSALMSGNMGTLEAPLNHSKGCGGVMRTAPLGFIPARKEQRADKGAQRAMMLGAKAAAITHGHPLGWLPAGMLSDIVWRCVYRTDELSLENIIAQALADVSVVFGQYDSSKLDSLIKNAVWLSRLSENENGGSDADEKSIRALGEGWVGEEALAIAVYAALRYPDNIEKCLVAAVNHSGDSDSTGAIAGNILGAYLGTDALPEGWAEKLDVYDAVNDTARRLSEAL